MSVPSQVFAPKYSQFILNLIQRENRDRGQSTSQSNSMDDTHAVKIAAQGRRKDEGKLEKGK